MRTIVLMAVLICLGSGCSTIDSIEIAPELASDIASIFAPDDPQPAACASNAGAVINGKVCVKMDNGTWRWVPSSKVP